MENQFHMFHEFISVIFKVAFIRQNWYSFHPYTVLAGT